MDNAAGTHTSPSNLAGSQGMHQSPPQPFKSFRQTDLDLKNMKVCGSKVFMFECIGIITKICLFNKKLWFILPTAVEGKCQINEYNVSGELLRTLQISNVNRIKGIFQLNSEKFIVNSGNALLLMRDGHTDVVTELVVAEGCFVDVDVNCDVIATVQKQQDSTQNVLLLKRDSLAMEGSFPLEGEAYTLLLVHDNVFVSLQTRQIILYTLNGVKLQEFDHPEPGFLNPCIYDQFGSVMVANSSYDVLAVIKRPGEWCEEVEVDDDILVHDAFILDFNLYIMEGEDGIGVSRIYRYGLGPINAPSSPESAEESSSP